MFQFGDSHRELSLFFMNKMWHLDKCFEEKRCALEGEYRSIIFFLFELFIGS